MFKPMERHDVYLTVEQGTYFKVHGTHSGNCKSAEIRGVLQAHIENEKRLENNV